MPRWCGLSDFTFAGAMVIRSRLLAGIAGLVLGAVVLTIACRGRGDDAGSTSSTEQPRLVVALVIDQLRPDLLDRYSGLYAGGFRRLLDGGFRFNAVHDHAYTETAAGHATLSTGVLPSRTGIPGNEWHEQVGPRWPLVYAVFDSMAPILDHPEAPGRSPMNIRRAGFADWLVSADPASQVVSLSRKDRAAITMAAHAMGEVYWILPSAGRFVTSRHYAETMPEWVSAFNRDSMPQFYSDSVWWSELTPDAAVLARPDSAAHEMDGVHVAFPHRYGDLAGTSDDSDYATWVTEHTPWPDAAVLALARTALRTLDLGQDEVPDYLSLSLSQTDAIGHDYGPLSVEQLDNLMRLDRELGRFFEFLDAAVGADHWVLGLSADHGVLTAPEERVAAGLPGHRRTAGELTEARGLARAAAAAGTDDGLSDRVVAALETLPWIVDAYTSAELVDRRLVAGDSMAELFANSHVPGRVMGSFYRYGVEVRVAEGLIGDAFGTTHGSPWLYDRQVPLLFYGAGVAYGWSADRTRTTDFAPTLADLAGIPSPADLDGRSLAPLITAR